MIPLVTIIACFMLSSRLYGAKKEPWWLNDPRVLPIMGAGPNGETIYIRPKV
jgi:hypothetical protein